MTNKIFLLAFMSVLSTNANAACYGESSYQTCFDEQSGNSYSIARYGSTTNLNGYNARTGSVWNQNSNTLGNTTFHSGAASNGRTWHGTTTTLGDSIFYSGTDSNGRSYDGSYTKGPQLFMD